MESRSNTENETSDLTYDPKKVDYSPLLDGGLVDFPWSLLSITPPHLLYQTPWAPKKQEIQDITEFSEEEIAKEIPELDYYLTAKKNDQKQLKEIKKQIKQIKQLKQIENSEENINQLHINQSILAIQEATLAKKIRKYYHHINAITYRFNQAYQSSWKNYSCPRNRAGLEYCLQHLEAQIAQTNNPSQKNLRGLKEDTVHYDLNKISLLAAKKACLYFVDKEQRESRVSASGMFSSPPPKRQCTHPQTFSSNFKEKP